MTPLPNISSVFSDTQQELPDSSARDSQQATGIHDDFRARPLAPLAEAPVITLVRKNI